MGELDLDYMTKQKYDIDGVEVKLFLESHSIQVGEKIIHISEFEFNILEYFLKNSNKYSSPMDIGKILGKTNHNIHCTLNRLITKFESQGLFFIENEKGSGFGIFKVTEKKY